MPAGEYERKIQDVAGKLGTLPQSVFDDLGKGLQDAGEFLRGIIPVDENGEVKKVTLAQGLAALAAIGFIGSATVNEYKASHNMQDASLTEVMEDMAQHPVDALHAVEKGVPEQLRRGVGAFGALVGHLRGENTAASSAKLDQPPALPSATSPWPHEPMTPSTQQGLGSESSGVSSDQQADRLTYLQPTAPVRGGHGPDVGHPARDLVLPPNTTSDEPSSPPASGANDRVETSPTDMTTTTTAYTDTRPRWRQWLLPAVDEDSFHPNAHAVLRHVTSQYDRLPEHRWAWQKEPSNTA